ncbi:hypothetical protein Pcinc_008342 [Petrolisthes cinctipes]|uniref:Uncharacterized protein n=1 Tax=Petrolisthes cinctipes TaxID=88211 RepID=A0AAE1G6V2_PETCI|nr:hypothetical protein Pcinc_008342 [Petrolisthes cinctipes]
MAAAVLPPAACPAVTTELRNDANSTATIAPSLGSFIDAFSTLLQCTSRSVCTCAINCLEESLLLSSQHITDVGPNIVSLIQIARYTRPDKEFHIFDLEITDSPF